MYKNYMSKQINLKNFSLKNIGLAVCFVLSECPLDLMIEDIIQINTVTKVLTKFLNPGNKVSFWGGYDVFDSFWYKFLLVESPRKSLRPMRRLLHLYLITVFYTAHLPIINESLGVNNFLVNLFIFYVIYNDLNYILYHVKIW